MPTGLQPGLWEAKWQRWENNFALADMPVNIPAATEDRTAGWMGIDKTSEEAQSKETFAQSLGWNFESVWLWDEVSLCPMLKSFVA